MSGRHSNGSDEAAPGERELDPASSHRGGATTTSPWRRGPLLLFRHPAVFLAVVAATAVLAVTAASGVLFVSTLDTASLRAQASGDCPERHMPAFAAQTFTSKELPTARAAGLRAMNAHDPLGTPYTVELGFAMIQTIPITFYSRAGALDHVTKLRGSDGPGVWFPDDYATKLHLAPGSTITTTDGKSIRVAGIYRSMSPSPFALPDVPDYYCNWQDLIIRHLGERGVGPFLISDEKTIADASTLTQVSVYDPIPLDSVSVDSAEAANRRADAASEAFRNSNYDYVNPDASPYAAAPSATTATLDAMIDKARESRSGVAGSIVPIDIAGVLVAALLVAAAGAYWATNRAREIRLLVARGVGPGPLALKAVLETGPPTIVGLAAGIAIAVGLVRVVSPAQVFEPGAAVGAGWAAVGAIVFGLAVIGLIGATASRDRLVGIKASWRTHIPWELALLVVAIGIGVHIKHAPNVTVTQTVIDIHPILVIFPLLGSLAVLLVFARVLALALPLIRRRLSGGGTAFYLALRRLAGARGISVGLVVCVALPGALLTYTSAITKSVHDEVVAKYRTNVGAARVLTVVGIENGTPDLHGHGTLVSTIGSVPHLPGDKQSYVLGIDPSTFTKFALTTPDQAALVEKLHSVDDGGVVPAILVNAPDGQDASSVAIERTELRLDVVGRTSVFPGLRVGSQPLVVVDRTALAAVDPNVDRTNQVWTSQADHTVLRSLLERDGFSVLADVTPQTLVSDTGLLPLTWIFDYLRALAIMIGLVAIVGLVFALAARTRQRTVSYVLSRRMGLSRIAHLRALVVELTIVVGIGYAAGLIVGTGGFRIILGGLNVYPEFPPPPSFATPVSTWILTGAVWVVVVLAAALGVQVFADRAKPAEILRLE